MAPAYDLHISNSNEGDRVSRWVRDQDPRSSSSTPLGERIDPEVLAACDGFDEAWAETLAGVQVRVLRFPFPLLPPV